MPRRYTLGPVGTVRPFDVAKAYPGDQMPEILTESFCERCGTRYTFESTAPRGPRLKGLRVMSRGLKNFVLSDDTSIDEAMAAARSESDREVTAQQLDAFHKTFNFCMSCRQYTCANCWNEGEGRCLSCAPHLGQDILPAPFPQLDASGTLISNGTSANGHGNGHVVDGPTGSASPVVEPMSWPTSDLFREPEGPTADVPLSDPALHEAFDPPTAVASDAAAVDPLGQADDEPTDLLARLAGLDLVEETAIPDPSLSTFDPVAAEPVVEASVAEPVVAEPVVEASVAAEPVAAELVAEAPVQEAPSAAPSPGDQTGSVTGDTGDVAATAAGQTADLLRRFRPGQSLDDAIAEFEREQATAGRSEPDTAASTAPEGPDSLAPEPEGAAAASAPEPEAGAAPAPEPEAFASATPAPPDAAGPVTPDVPMVAEPEPEPESESGPAPSSIAPPEPETVSEPVAAWTAAPEPEAEAVSEPVALEAPAPQPDPEPAPIAAVVPDPIEASAPEPVPAGEPDAATAPEPPPVAPRVDVVAQPTWQVVAPDGPPGGGAAPQPHPRTPAVPAPDHVAASGEPQWPSRPEWPVSAQAGGLPFLGRPAAASGGIEALWAESAREVASAPVETVRATGGVQPCVSCGLSLSANARFCRRCGTRQG